MTNLDEGCKPNKSLLTV